MSFCSKCGKEISGGSQFCSGCGQPISGQTAQQTTYQQPPYQQAYSVTPGDLLKKLSGKVRAEAILWIVLASLQLAIRFFCVVIGLFLYNYGNYNYEYSGMVYIVLGVPLLIVAALNYALSSRAFKYSRDVLLRPVGIVAKYTPVGGLIGMLIYSILFGGFVGVGASIIGFQTQNFVMTNIQAFNAIEASYSSNTAPHQ